MIFVKNMQVSDMSLHQYGITVVIIKWNYFPQDGG